MIAELMIMVVKKGDNVKVEYVGSLEDGTIFDASQRHGAPLQFEVGSGQVIAGFDSAVVGMNLGEQKTISIPPEKAYGNHSDDLIIQAPKKDIPENENLKPGFVILAKFPDGSEMPARVIKLEGETVTMDFNHPLAGKTLKFTITVVSVSSGKEKSLTGA